MNKLVVRLTAAFLLSAVLVVVVIVLAINQAVESNFRDYIGQANNLEQSEQLLTQLEAHYAKQGSWEGVQDLLTQGRHNTNGSGARLLVADAHQQIVGDTATIGLQQQLSDQQQRMAVPLGVKGLTVGYFVRETPSQGRIQALQNNFLMDINRTLLWIALGASSLAFLLGSGLAWGFSSPLHRLNIAAKAIANGELGIQAPVRGARELQQMALSFNQMSAALAENAAVRQRMASDIAHELRTPVSVMRTQLEGMLDGVLLTDVQQIGIVYNQTLHLARLVEDLRVLTRAEAKSLPLEKKEVNITALLRQVVQDFEPLAQDSGIKLTLSAEVLPPLQADRGRLQQVFSNLLANALQYTPEGGQVNVIAMIQEGQLQITFADTGIGLSLEQTKHVFDRFYRTDEAHQRNQSGSGLGLAISRELLRLHGGDLKLDSQLGLGSRFIITLPLKST